MGPASPMRSAAASFAPSSRDSGYRALSRMLAGTWAPTDRYYLDPPRLMRDALHPPDPWQAALASSTARRVLVLCARQSGKSLTAAALALLTAILEPPALVLIVARAQRQAAELLRKAKLLYAILARRERPPAWAPRPVRELEAEERRGLTAAEALTQDSVLAMEMANGSRIISLPGKADTIVGYSAASLIIIDEAARCPDELYYLLRPMLAVSGGRLVCLSTPFGKRGFFYEAWTKGAGWERYRVTAYECPRIGPEFLAEERVALGAHWFGQEYLLEFRDAIDQVFRQEDIDAMFRDDVEPLFVD